MLKSSKIFYILKGTCTINFSKKFEYLYVACTYQNGNTIKEQRNNDNNRNKCEEKSKLLDLFSFIIPEKLISNHKYNGS